MLVQEEITQPFTEISQLEKPPKTPFIFPKKAFLIGFLLILGIAIFIFAIIDNPKTDEYRLLELITRIEGGEELPSGELKDYCHLMAVLQDSISPQCVCVLDGINWDNPPRNPERLPEVWEFIEDDPNQGYRPRYQHKIYQKIVIGFDADDSNGNEKPHWHRENPNKKQKKVQYLDKDCNAVRRSAPHSHIYVRTQK